MLFNFKSYFNNACTTSNWCALTWFNLCRLWKETFNFIHIFVSLYYFWIAISHLFLPICQKSMYQKYSLNKPNDSRFRCREFKYGIEVTFIFHINIWNKINKTVTFKYRWEIKSVNDSIVNYSIQFYWVKYKPRTEIRKQPRTKLHEIFIKDSINIEGSKCVLQRYVCFAISTTSSNQRAAMKHQKICPLPYLSFATTNKTQIHKFDFQFMTDKWWNV